MAPWTKTSVDVDGAEGVGAGAGCAGAVAGADEVTLVSGIGTALRSLSSRHSGKCISGSLALPLLHIILKLLYH